MTGILDGYHFDWNGNTVGNTVTPGGILQGLVSTQIPMQMPATGGFAPAPGSAPNPAPGGAAPPVPMAGNAIGRPADPQDPLAALFGGIGTSLSGGLAGLFGSGGPAGMAQAPSLQAPGLQAPGLLDRLTAGATNLTTGGNPLAGVFNAVNGLATGQRTDRAGLELAKQHATMSALMNAGLDLDTARAAAINPDFLKALVVAHYGARPGRSQSAAAPRPGTEQAGRKRPPAGGSLDASTGLPAGPPPDIARPRT